MCLDPAIIRRLFDEALLRLLPEMGLGPGDVAWPNNAFAPVAKRIYLRPALLPGEIIPASLGRDCFLKSSGIYQISICAPKGSGLGEAEACARILLDAFRPGLGMRCGNLFLRVTGIGAARMLEDDDRLALVAGIMWRCHAGPPVHSE